MKTSVGCNGPGDVSAHNNTVLQHSIFVHSWQWRVAEHNRIHAHVSTATMVTRTQLNITLYVQGLSFEHTIHYSSISRPSREGSWCTKLPEHSGFLFEKLTVDQILKKWPSLWTPQVPHSAHKSPPKEFVTRKRIHSIRTCHFLWSKSALRLCIGRSGTLLLSWFPTVNLSAFFHISYSWRRVHSIGCMILTEVNRSTGRKICPSAACFNTDVTWTGLGSKRGLGSETPATDSLNYGTVI